MHTNSSWKVEVFKVFIWIVECDSWAVAKKITKLSRKMNPTFLFLDEYRS